MADPNEDLETPPPDPELKRLERLLGTWRAEDHTRDTVLGGPGVPVTSKETFEWLDGGYFLVSTYDTVFGDEPAQKGVMYWGYDSTSKAFATSSSATTGRSPRMATAMRARSPTAN
jgi:Protein of unknown function (DUF1579)